MKIVSKSDLQNMVIRLNTVTGKGAWIYKDAQGYAIKDSKGSNMFSVCGLSRRDALNRCHAYIEGWQYARDAVIENWLAERTVISAPRYCNNTLFVNEGGAA